jgi:hypothetical protein
MGFLGSRTQREGDRGIYLYIRVTKSGETIKVRIDPANDLVQEFDPAGGDNPTHYTCYKEVIGNRSFHAVELNLDFDNRRRLQDKKIVGGRFISEAEYVSDGLAGQNDNGGD